MEFSPREAPLTVHPSMGMLAAQTSCFFEAANYQPKRTQQKQQLEQQQQQQTASKTTAMASARPKQAFQSPRPSTKPKPNEGRLPAISLLRRTTSNGLAASSSSHGTFRQREEQPRKERGTDDGDDPPPSKTIRDSSKPPVATTAAETTTEREIDEALGQALASRTRSIQRSHSGSSHSNNNNKPNLLPKYQNMGRFSTTEIRRQRQTEATAVSKRVGAPGAIPPPPPLPPSEKRSIQEAAKQASVRPPLSPRRNVPQPKQQQQQQNYCPPGYEPNGMESFSSFVNPAEAVLCKMVSGHDVPETSNPAFRTPPPVEKENSPSPPPPPLKKSCQIHQICYCEDCFNVRSSWEGKECTPILESRNKKKNKNKTSNLDDHQRKEKQQRRKNRTEEPPATAKTPPPSPEHYEYAPSFTPPFVHALSSNPYDDEDGAWQSPFRMEDPTLANSNYDDPDDIMAWTAGSHGQLDRKAMAEEEEEQQWTLDWLVPRTTASPHGLAPSPLRTTTAPCVARFAAPRSLWPSHDW